MRSSYYKGRFKFVCRHTAVGSSKRTKGFPCTLEYVLFLGRCVEVPTYVEQGASFGILQRF